jgi:nephrocystin-3
MSLWKRLFGSGKSDKNQPEHDSEAPAPASASAQCPPGDTPPGTAGNADSASLWQEKVTPANTSSAPPDADRVSNPDPKSSAKDRVVRVFVSSTFRDMIEDRNELMAHVWPALRKVCRGRAVEFVEVDLRWGVTEEQSQRKETLRHCLAEIKRCRPYFIGLLGERYGWTPGPEAFTPALLDEEDWLKREVAKHSVTELEIYHGVLNDPEMAGRAFFYFRDPHYAASQGGDYLAEDAACAARQEALKQKVRAVCDVKGIPLHENYAHPHALAVLVLADLTGAIDAEFPPDQTPDDWSREDRDHEAYAKSRRTAFYIGRDAYFNRLDAFARDGADGCGLTILGASGGGKSALLANWVARRRQVNPNDFVFQHYIGSSAMSAGHLALMRRLMVAIVRWCGADDPAGASGLEEEEKKIPAAAEEIVKVFPDYLSRLAGRARQKGVRAVLVLDALNQLEDRERGRLLAWLPYRLPGELRLVVSALPGDTLDALQPRDWPALTVEPLTTEERVRLIARYLAHFAQGLSESRARKIAGAAAASNPLYIKTLLDDLRATGDHELLDRQIADYLQAADIPALLGKILTRFERDYERDWPGLVREALSLLWAARRGLTEPELLEALKPAGQERLPAALWSPVRCALEDGLVDRDGVLAFAHEYLHVAVERRYVPDAGTARALRLRLADEFAARSVDARQADELPWLLRQAESRDRLRACLLDIYRFLLMQKRDWNELLGYWVWLREERSMGQPAGCQSTV